MSYKVNFSGVGYTAPDASNPKGIHVRASGHVIVEGERPDSNFRIPQSAIEQTKAVFMRQTGCVRFKGDTAQETHYPTVWLGKKSKT